MAMDMTADRLLDLYAAPTVAVARGIGDEWGWTRMSDAETDEWRRHFLHYNGGTLEHVSWRRETVLARNRRLSGLRPVPTAIKPAPIRPRHLPKCWRV